MTDRNQPGERDRQQDPNQDPSEEQRERKLPSADEVLPPGSQAPDRDEKQRKEERNRNQGTEGGRSPNRKPRQ